MKLWQADPLRRLEVIPDPVQELLPLPVVPDWEQQVARAGRLTGLIDRHLNYEERGRRMLRGEKLTPIGLCPEQRVQMLTDVRMASHS